MLRAQSNSNARALLFCQRNVNALTEIPNRVPSLIAEFDNRKAIATQGFFKLRLGVSGCPPSTTQVIFFSDEEELINDPDEMETDLCLVVRGTPVNRTLWSPEPGWEVNADHRLFAAIITAGGGASTIQGSLCAALQNRYGLLGTIPQPVVRALATLAANSEAQ